MPWFREQLLTIGFALLLAILAANAILSFGALETLDTNEEWVAHSHRVISAVDVTLATLVDAETGQRGYLLTGDSIYLRPYQKAVELMEDRLAAVAQLTIDNPRQRQRLDVFRPLVHRRFERIRETIRILQQEGADSARALVAAGVGLRMMDSLRQIVVEMKREEETLLREREVESADSYERAQFTFGLSSTIAVALVIAVFVLMRRERFLQKQREDDLRESRVMLERRVAERTAELLDANDTLEREVIERTRAERRLKSFTRELERSNRELQEFAFVASHDLQEPLRKIQAFGDRLKTKYGEAIEETGRDYIDRMQKAAHRMHVLINDLLTFSRVTSKAQPFRPVDLGLVVREVLEDLEVRVQQTGGSVEVGELPTIDADALQMRQLFQNLIGNALKFHRPDVPPHVAISARPLPGSIADGESCEILVEDNGIGFEEQYLEKLFVPFQRLHGRGEFEGTGMGLAVCRRIAERHNGAITAHSSVGIGTTFIITLPLRQQQEHITPENGKADHDTDGR